MIIPEIKLLIKLNWHLGIPDGEMEHKAVERYSNRKSDIESIIRDVMYNSSLRSEYMTSDINYSYSNIYSIDSNDTGFRIATATVDTVMVFDDRVFKLQEVFM
jgi:hypothetical protein